MVGQERERHKEQEDVQPVDEKMFGGSERAGRWFGRVRAVEEGSVFG